MHMKKSFWRSAKPFTHFTDGKTEGQKEREREKPLA